MVLVTTLLACHSDWNLQRALTLSGKDEDNNPPEKPGLWIRVVMGSRCEHR